jgi:hypothetical protein
LFNLTIDIVYIIMSSRRKTKSRRNPSTRGREQSVDMRNFIRTADVEDVEEDEVSVALPTYRPSDRLMSMEDVLQEDNVELLSQEDKSSINDVRRMPNLPGSIEEPDINDFVDFFDVKGIINPRCRDAFDKKKINKAVHKLVQEDKEKHRHVEEPEVYTSDEDDELDNPQSHQQLHQSQQLFPQPRMIYPEEPKQQRDNKARNLAEMILLFKLSGDTDFLYDVPNGDLISNHIEHSIAQLADLIEMGSDEFKNTLNQIISEMKTNML